MDEENLIRMPVETQQASGREESVHTEVLGQHPDNATVGEENVAPGLKIFDETTHTVPEIAMGFAAGNGKTAESTEDLTIDGIGLLVGAALERPEVALTQTGVGNGLPPGETRALNSANKVRGPHAVELLTVDHRAQGLRLPATVVSERWIAPACDSFFGRVGGLSVSNEPELESAFHPEEDSADEPVLSFEF